MKNKIQRKENVCRVYKRRSPRMLRIKYVSRIPHVPGILLPVLVTGFKYYIPCFGCECKD